jgi:hypothetical protein
MQGGRNEVIVSKRQKVMKCPLRVPDPLSPKSKYLITIDIIIIILGVPRSQPGTTGPTSTSTSTNYNLNKEKKREKASAKDRKESGL